MPYLVSLLLVVLGLVVLAALVVPVLRSLRRFAVASRALRATTGDGVGLLRARAAALRVAVAERRAGDLDEPSTPRTI
ncbi:bacteriophage holin [Streptoalloteichus tenebrarius]|uniref:bacteriophage holin n=1 Tax=Streptoalloteichus tenebrarius (strain ATCC 17920 / DSM 40477 / JCM 4838 / CBS 697.72 / NBRC 16177 / NCIMB 11028 / NRRL B-12390 / A12253. 1 / ISP 5477) TaxID=1933 RepID=UPI0020A39B6B|nr:bacteriophage holin [Streptoalloteichus tenebrarius]